MQDAGDDAQTPQGRPADACPFARPFPPRFHDCPAYQPAYFIALNTAYDSMPPVWSCSNLRVGSVPGRQGRFYAACRIGDEKARLEWVATLRSQRVETLQGLQRDLAQATATLAGEVMSAKGDQLQAPAESQARAQATVRLERLVARLLAACEAFFEERADTLRRLELPPEPLRRLLEDVMAGWVAQPDTSPPEVPEEALERFPADVRILLQPGRDPE